MRDELVRDNILKAYNFKGRKKGARQIKMTLRRSIWDCVQFKTY